MHEQGKLGKKLNIILGFKPSLYNLNKHMKDAFTLKNMLYYQEKYRIQMIYIQVY